jgi:hypothetical protein
MDDYAVQMYNALQEDAGDLSRRLPDARLAEIDALRAEQGLLAEALDQVRAMLTIEDEGWKKLMGGQGVSDDLTGFNLKDLAKFAKEIRSFMVGVPLIENAANLRANYVWSKGVTIPGSEKAPKQGRPSTVYKFTNDPVNVQNLFSAGAHDRLEHAAASDGIVFLAGDDAKKTVREIPVWEFTDVYVNPDFPGEVWAFRRQWESYSGTTPKQMDRWYYTDTFTGGKRQASISIGGKAVPVDKGITLFTQNFNGQVGWPLGVPDLIAAVAWAKMYSDAMKRGKQMTDAMAQIAYKAVAQTAGGAQGMAVKIAGAGGAGNAAAMTTGNDLVPLTTAGKGYDFTSLRPIAAMVAAAAQVSTIDLLSDPSAAGSSYGSAATLDPPKKRAVIVRQELWKGFLKRILKWGTGTDVDLFFPELEDPDLYRDMQRLILAQQSGLIFGDELRPKILNNLDAVNLHNDKLPPPPPVPVASPGAQAASPDQGKSNGTGGNSRNDQRTDVISNSLLTFDLDRLQELVERLERAKNG